MMAATENAKKTNDYKYIIVHLLEDVPVGSTFNKWSLHVTILPWIALEEDEEKLIKLFKLAFKLYKSFITTVGEESKFGPKKDVPVSLLKGNEWLKLHQKALDLKTSINARWAESRPYVDQQFMPHIAQRKGVFLESGKELQVGSINLVRAKRQDDGVREVASKVVFA